ncbi:cell envelope integrity TolA C-terminal domain-containing protein [Aeromonas simiae]|uniref:cell envelope integrity TolA C-terminal domain-containing protein n=1 Tax=Aeromonas simiae TaxID=218936 RepID=UPI00266CC0C9|nr:cell envelope integrity TolA C-terminal domain-containing protein [Aeromonas simiae]MDO2948892.1 hypothetical protein [Aeromonas simiae]MDO2951960.1 hypothetical protein [Aeromonas simiae]MDO2956275.1 hypothetical protein [Aeromonas simiae]
MSREIRFRLNTVLALMIGFSAGIASGYYYAKWEPTLHAFYSLVQQTSSATSEAGDIPNHADLEAKRQAARMALLDAQRNRGPDSETGHHGALIVDTLRRHMKTDPAMRGKTCRLTLTLANDGAITAMMADKGDPQVCQAGINAAQKAGRVPMSRDPAIYRQLRQITLLIDPFGGGSPRQARGPEVR